MKLEYSISEIFSILLRHIGLIILCAAIGGIISFSFSKYVIDQKYTASVTMCAQLGGSSLDWMAPLNELEYAKNVVQTNIEILKTNTFLNTVSIASGLDYSEYDLKEMIKFSVVNDTEIFRVAVVTKDPNDSFVLANAIGDLAPITIKEIKNRDEIKLIDPATLPSSSSSPNIIINTAVGLTMGMMVGVIAAFIFKLLDQRVRDEEDITERYGLPILGSVPNII